jgi:hypothetical protein
VQELEGNLDRQLEQGDNRILELLKDMQDSLLVLVLEQKGNRKILLEQVRVQVQELVLNQALQQNEPLNRSFLIPFPCT